MSVTSNREVRLLFVKPVNRSILPPAGKTYSDWHGARGGGCLLLYDLIYWIYHRSWQLMWLLSMFCQTFHKAVWFEAGQTSNHICCTAWHFRNYSNKTAIQATPRLFFVPLRNVPSWFVYFQDLFSYEAGDLPPCKADTITHTVHEKSVFLSVHVSTLKIIFHRIHEGEWSHVSCFDA